MSKKLVIIIFAVLFTASAFASTLTIKGNQVFETKPLMNMTKEMKAVPFVCLQKAYKNGSTICELSNELDRLEWGFPIVKTDKVTSQEISFSNNTFKFGKSKITLSSSNDVVLLLFWVVCVFLCIIVLNLLNGYQQISRRKLLLFDISLIGVVLFSRIVGVLVGGLAGVLVGGLAGVLAGGFAGVLVGGLAGELAGGFAGVLAGVLAGGFAGVLAGVLAGVFASQGYGFWESVERAMIPEYLGFLLVTFLIGFVVREIAFKIATKKALQEVEV